MKIQHLAVIFIIIILPISMVISYYVNVQIDTIAKQELYDAKLVTATYDSIRSFQLNTINNKYSSVSDSKIRDIEAGITSFFNSLGTELGATGYSREDLTTFIPAIVYTMYDGYYTYGKYYDPGIDDYKIGLKPYVYYSCKYKNNQSEFVVNYTLDNTISIYGNVGGENGAWTGALIKIGYVTDIVTDTYSYETTTHKTESREICMGLTYDGVKIKPEILEEKFYDINNNSIGIYEYTMYNNQKIYLDKKIEDDGTVKIIGYFINNKNKKQYINDAERIAFLKALTNDEGHLQSNSACQYFYDAYKFSSWIADNDIDKISQKDAIDETIEENDKQIKDFDINTEKDEIFNVTGEDPMLESSTFNQNRISVIKRTIKSNLVAEMANYNKNSGYEYAMPELTYEDWDKIVNNMSVTVFMQGMPLGMKFYNNYCVISNDKNKEVVTDDSIYIIDSNEEVHYPGCKDLVDNKCEAVIGYRNIDFERQTVVDSSNMDVYYYPHDNQKCYSCMVNADVTYDLEDIIKGKIHKIVDGEKMEKEEDILSPTLRKVYLTALAREKYDLYRTNGYFGAPT